MYIILGYYILLYIIVSIITICYHILINLYYSILLYIIIYY